MARLIEFIGNHPFIFVALAVVIGMIVFYEYQQRFSGVKQGFIMGSEHIPMSNFDKRMVELEKKKAKPVIVYCTSGQRSSSAARKLVKAGFESVYTLAGGAVAWEKASLPLGSKA